MPNFNLAELNAAEHPADEPEAALEGWSAADLDDDELVDDDFVEQDESSFPVDEGDDIDYFYDEDDYWDDLGPLTDDDQLAGRVDR